MTPTFVGRIVTRIFLVLVVGVLWTLLITPLLPGDGALGDKYQVTFTALAVVLVLGVVLWEPIYHGLQQYRWERDWPSLFALLVVINEAVLAWFVLKAVGPDGATGGAFIIHIVSTWVLMWLFVQGPMRILFVRYRYHGGLVPGGF